MLELFKYQNIRELYFEISKYDVKILETSDRISFSIIKNQRSVAELSRISNDVVEMYLKTKVVGEWYYFNRLIVAKEVRGQGIATELLFELAKWADKKKKNILNEINPYGDLSLNNLISLYKKIGFVSTNTKGLMVRYFK